MTVWLGRSSPTLRWGQTENPSQSTSTHLEPSPLVLVWISRSELCPLAGWRSSRCSRRLVRDFALTSPRHLEHVCAELLVGIGVTFIVDEFNQLFCSGELWVYCCHPRHVHLGVCLSERLNLGPQQREGAKYPLARQRCCVGNLLRHLLGLATERKATILAIDLPLCDETVLLAHIGTKGHTVDALITDEIKRHATIRNLQGFLLLHPGKLIAHCFDAIYRHCQRHLRCDPFGLFLDHRKYVLHALNTRWKAFREHLAPKILDVER
mmetsp:Transcript_25373/g.66362  ORF Transcript_25373/g.66362 Transcript_25373/m.66362 type:complete len:266 (-) Transcript_25373:42-839(-)